ncbi:thioredoxin [Pleomorphovibrio marinus]|uniref:thioredoxin n=1 Tax=Pleomorphovibrio marinus TaxID=2164132 RepID=UPI000E0C1B7B|nr:thioredoxin [Pleomorphovibrio marinus]
MANSSKFRDLINGKQPVLVDFYATWCGPCQALQPILQEVSLALKEKVKVIKVDVDKNQLAAKTFQVKGVPTLILFHKGNQVWRQSGVLSAQQILNAINSHLPTLVS